MFGSMMGLEIITSAFACSQKRRVRGVPAARKPNCQRPFYRRVTVYSPLIYKTGNRIICHVSLLEPIKAIAEGRSKGFGKDMSWTEPDLLRGVPISVARRLAKQRSKHERSAGRN